jgi:bile acid-coenzyme A ligase
VSEVESAALLPSTDEEGIPFGEQLRQRALANPDLLALTMVTVDGVERGFTLDQVDRGANRWARTLARRGALLGALVGIAIPNSLELVLAALACWKIGAIPVPMRWDLPDWERTRLLDTLRAAVVVDEHNREELAAASDVEADTPLPEALSPMVNGICSSGSTGLPKIILNTRPAAWTPALSEPFAAHWAPVPRPQIILVPGPMYHTNGFNPLVYLLGGDRLVVLETFSAATASRHQLHRNAYDAEPHRRRTGHRATRPVQRGLDHARGGSHAARPAAPLVRPVEPRAGRDGLRNDREPRPGHPAG